MADSASFVITTEPIEDDAIRYLSSHGDDDNDGLTPVAAMASPQAAYDSLPDDGGVVVVAPSGRYDLGDGLILDRAKRAEFVAPGQGNHSRNHELLGSNAVFHSSTGAAHLVEWTGGASNAYGFGFDRIMFEISPTTTHAFFADSVNMARIERCGAFHPFEDQVQAPFRFIEAAPTTGDDSSWWRLIDNYVRQGTLVWAVGYQVNQWVIRENICFSDQSDPMIYLEKAHRCVIRDNNLEGDTTAIHLKGSWACRLDGNAGERADPFILLDGANANLVTDMGISYPGTKCFCRMVNGAKDNLVMAAVGTGMSNLYNHADWIDDPSEENWIIAPSSHNAPERVYLSQVVTP